jgi:hypothetical protein
MAREALDEGDEQRALNLAQRAVDLDPGPTTWLAQQIRVEILERKGELDRAQGYLDAYLALPGLFTEHRAWGEEVWSRLAASRASRDAVLAAEGRALLTRRRVGIGLLLAGVAEQGVGAGFLINFHHQGADPAHSGGWQDTGLILSGVGAALWIPGVVLALSAVDQRSVSTVSFAPSVHVGAEGMSLGLVVGW